MKRLTSIAGYAWAVLAIPIVLATFMGMDFWARGLAGATGVIISPWFTGGEIARTERHEGYRTEIHRPVFDGLLGQRKEGFVQVTWMPEKETLPPVIDEAIDYDGDRVEDFFISLDTRTNEASLSPESSRVIGLGEIITLREGRVARVRLKNDMR